MLEEFDQLAGGDFGFDEVAIGLFEMSSDEDINPEQLQCVGYLAGIGNKRNPSLAGVEGKFLAGFIGKDKLVLGLAFGPGALLSLTVLEDEHFAAARRQSRCHFGNTP